MHACLDSNKLTLIDVFSALSNHANRLGVAVRDDKLEPAVRDNKLETAVRDAQLEPAPSVTTHGSPQAVTLSECP